MYGSVARFYLEAFVFVCTVSVPLVDLQSAIIDEHVITDQTRTRARHLLGTAVKLNEFKT